MFKLHLEVGSSAPELVGEGHGFFHGTVNRVTVVITGLYCPQVYRNGWQHGLDVRVIQMFIYN